MTNEMSLAAWFLELKKGQLQFALIQICQVTKLPLFFGFQFKVVSLPFVFMECLF